MKPLCFLGSSRDDLVAFPVEARRTAGHELRQVQNGLMPSDFKPMGGVGPGAYELRIHVEGEWRIIFVAKLKDAIYVLHAFEKKTQKTRQEDIEVARKRYKSLRS